MWMVSFEKANRDTVVEHTQMVPKAEVGCAK